jgi:hypothetical protein
MTSETRIVVGHLAYEHGSGKRWDGDRYTCTRCRARADYLWHIYADMVSVGTTVAAASTSVEYVTFAAAPGAPVKVTRTKV